MGLVPSLSPPAIPAPATIAPSWHPHWSSCLHSSQRFVLTLQLSDLSRCTWDHARLPLPSGAWPPAYPAHLSAHLSPLSTAASPSACASCTVDFAHALPCSSYPVTATLPSTLHSGICSLGKPLPPPPVWVAPPSTTWPQLQLNGYMILCRLLLWTISARQANPHLVSFTTCF